MEHFEKVATRAWKKHYGRLSSKSRQKLRDSNILDSNRELKGLEKGTKNIFDKNNAEFYDYKSPHYRQIYDRIKNRYNINPDSIGTMSDINMNPGQSEEFAFRHNKADVLMTPRPLGRMQSKIPPLNKTEYEYLSSIIKRHEADEIRLMRRLGSDKYRIASHVHPKVIKYESENAAIAPDNVRSAMVSFRKQTYEIPYFKRKLKFKYGRDAKNTF